MANSNGLVHGAPLQAKSKTGETPVEGTVRARLSLTFDLDLTRFGGPVIEDITPPSRIIVEVARVIAGEEAISRLPPQPNTLIGKFLPPPKPKK